MTTHEMGLREGPFGRMARGEKTVEVRLDDEKRRNVAVGDRISFRLDAPEGRTKQTLTVEVLEVVRRPDFASLAERFAPAAFGFATFDEAIDNFDTYYPLERQVELGIVAFRVRKVAGQPLQPTI